MASLHSRAYIVLAGTRQVFASGMFSGTPFRECPTGRYEDERFAFPDIDAAVYALRSLIEAYPHLNLGKSGTVSVLTRSRMFKAFGISDPLELEALQAQGRGVGFDLAPVLF